MDSIELDIERLERALAGPRFLVPIGMTSDELIAYLDEVAENIETGGVEILLP
jgi:hypothetical protein